MNTISSFRACPSCGSEDVESKGWSAEYRGGVKYWCNDCDYKYHYGSGMGVGSSSRGKHPRKFGSGDEGKIVTTAEWCSECHVVTLPGQCDCVPDAEVICNECAKFSKHDEEKMRKLVRAAKRDCDWCGENGARLVV